MLNRRQFLRTAVFAGTGVLCAPMINRGRFRLFADPLAGPAPEVSARAIELVGRSLVIDMLGLLTLDWGALWAWQADPKGFSQDDLLKLRGSGVNVFHPAVEPSDADAHASCLEWIAGWNRLVRGRPDAFLRIDTAADLARAKATGKVGLLLGFQNSDHFRTAADVALFHGLGQRVSQLTYNERNRIGSGCMAGGGGLTPYGAELVAAMNRAGMAIDISHCGDRTSLEAVAASKKPVLITHSNCRSLVAHPRCKSDEVIRRVAAAGGVMGITVIPAFVRQGQPATVEDVLDHFDHTARLAGVEHVGLGSDADIDAVDPQTRRVRPRYRVQGLRQARRVFEITEGLLRRGYSDAAIAGILGGNFQRALADIWGPPPAV
jgi:membrane dipeptidase